MGQLWHSLIAAEGSFEQLLIPLLLLGRQISLCLYDLLALAWVTQVGEEGRKDQEDNRKR